MLSDLDAQRAALAARHQGWRIWFVPRAFGKVTWCAQREPTLNRDSPEELERAISHAESGQSRGCDT
jgi:hypothetical protein